MNDSLKKRRIVKHILKHKGFTTDDLRRVDDLIDSIVISADFLLYAKQYTKTVRLLKDKEEK